MKTYEKELREIIKAWESLDSGYYDNWTIQAWISDKLKPTIDNARKALGLPNEEL